MQNWWQCKILQNNTRINKNFKLFKKTAPWIPIQLAVILSLMSELSSLFKLTIVQKTAYNK